MEKKQKENNVEDTINFIKNKLKPIYNDELSNTRNDPYSKCVEIANECLEKIKELESLNVRGNK